MIPSSIPSNLSHPLNFASRCPSSEHTQESIQSSGVSHSPNSKKPKSYSSHLGIMVHSSRPPQLWECAKKPSRDLYSDASKPRLSSQYMPVFKWSTIGVTIRYIASLRPTTSFRPTLENEYCLLI